MTEKVKNERFEKMLGNNHRKVIKDAVKNLEGLGDGCAETLGIMEVSSLIDYSVYMGYITSQEAEIYRQEAN